jgi:multisubunit Na+/H+ antiporter MnhE subunit
MANAAPSRIGNRAAVLLGRWFLAAALWLLLAATWSVAEVVAAAGVGAAVTAITVAVDRRRILEVSIDPRWLLGIVRLPSQVARDYVLLAKRLLRPDRRGVFRALPFDVGDESARSAGRRSLLTAGASLGPNTFVLDFDVERQVVLVHQLEPSARALPVEGASYP